VVVGKYLLVSDIRMYVHVYSSTYVYCVWHTYHLVNGTNGTSYTDMHTCAYVSHVGGNTWNTSMYDRRVNTPARVSGMGRAR
jgi:hypothetical protein